MNKEIKKTAAYGDLATENQSTESRRSIFQMKPADLKNLRACWQQNT